MHLDLSELSQLAPIFRELFKGYLVSRRDPELYAQLSNFQDQYRALFKALGFELVCDTRGFYYFVPDTATAQVNKTAQRLALFTFILGAGLLMPDPAWNGRLALLLLVLLVTLPLASHALARAALREVKALNDCSSDEQGVER